MTALQARGFVHHIFLFGIITVATITVVGYKISTRDKTSADGLTTNNSQLAKQATNDLTVTVMYNGQPIPDAKVRITSASDEKDGCLDAVDGLHLVSQTLKCAPGNYNVVYYKGVKGKVGGINGQAQATVVAGQPNAVELQAKLVSNFAGSGG